MKEQCRNLPYRIPRRRAQITALETTHTKELFILFHTVLRYQKTTTAVSDKKRETRKKEGNEKIVRNDHELAELLVQVAFVIEHGKRNDEENEDRIHDVNE